MSGEHGVEAHYQTLLPGPMDRRSVGAPHHVRWAELAILTVIDRCESCFDEVRDMIAAEPLALIAARRMSAIVIGAPQLIGGRGSSAEADEVVSIEAGDPEMIRWMFTESIQMAADHLAAAHTDHGHGQRQERLGRRKLVRRPGQRVRNREERRGDQ